MFIRIKDAVKKYGDGEAMVYALDHAELELEEGKICVILGPSGSGKSTLCQQKKQSSHGNQFLTYLLIASPNKYIIMEKEYP